MFSSLFYAAVNYLCVLAVWSPRLGKRKLVFVLPANLLSCLFVLSYSSSLWCRGAALMCDGGITWTFI